MLMNMNYTNVTVVPVLHEDGKQSFGCLHHVVVLVAKQQADPAAAVTDLRQLDTAPPQEAPQTVQIPVDLCGTAHSCCDGTQ